MGNAGNLIKLYTSQSETVIQAIKREGVCYSREEYVQRKYAESAPIFLTAYKWFVKEAGFLVPRPEGAEFPYWAFQDLYSIDQSGNNHILSLQVPMEEVVLFDMYDWNQILCLKYLGEGAQHFQEQLKLCGVMESDVMLTNFYPDWKQQIMESWSKLFRHDRRLKAGDNVGVKSVQAGLWRLKEEWIVQ